MSRIGKKVIAIPSGVTVTVDGGTVEVKGPKGTLNMPVHNAVTVVVAEEGVQVEKRHNAKIAQAMWGTTNRLIENMIIGVTDGFQKVLELNGVGFRMELKGKNLEMALGFSHPVVVPVPEGVIAEVEKMTLKLSGSDKQVVGQFAAEIRALKPVEPYKGKGFKYSDEIVRRKEGKKASAG